MPPRKRAAPAAQDSAAEPVPKRRSSRQAAIATSEPKDRPSAPKPGTKKDNAIGSRGRATESSSAKKSKTAAKASKPKPASKPATKKGTKDDGAAQHEAREASENPDVDDIPVVNPDAPRHDGEWYWLMKAEPESRFENGIDVRFSIDDLRAREKPEGWDGIRAYPARNHMRNMNAGDKAFFYHSNCKEPGIMGTMEIVREFSEDKSARRPGTPYYDPSSAKEKPRWSLVHVEFRSKFAVPIGLKELREMGQPGGPLAEMQMLKQSRLSVSRVSAVEWKALCGVADKKAKEAGLEHET